MGEVYPRRNTDGAISSEGGGTVAFNAAERLSLAAAPTFALMALLTGVASGGQPDLICSAPHHASPLSGMVPMYLLMSAFHAGPWLKLIFSRLENVRKPFASFRSGLHGN